MPSKAAQRRLIPPLDLPPRPRVKQARSELSTSRLLDAAAEVIAAGGYHRMTLKVIGERAGYSYGLVTERFGSKEGLLWTLVDSMLHDEDGGLVIPALGASTGVPALHRFVAAIREGWRRRPVHMRALSVLMFEAALPSPILQDAIACLHREMRAVTEAVVRAGIVEGSVPAEVDAAQISRTLLGSLRGVVFQAMLDPDHFSLEQGFDDLDHLVVLLLTNN
ncbi:TetR/AcrR family transcriptional regulator [Pseudonocardia xishanensis]|uniref:TetR/AcrR family transcriptional regulator n=1 Tax=Pseudonocardia xishanensis TaxID=630995 RepID=A0ABP8RUJ7_9PSEU